MRDPEEAREASEGLAYEEWRDRMSAVSEDAEQVETYTFVLPNDWSQLLNLPVSEDSEQEDPYELDDPKSDGYHDRMSAIADNAEQG